MRVIRASKAQPVRLQGDGCEFVSSILDYSVSTFRSLKCSLIFSLASKAGIFIFSRHSLLFLEGIAVNLCFRYVLVSG